jgi:hypothetical protein
MGISYAPFDAEPRSPPPRAEPAEVRPRPPAVQNKKMRSHEVTECNMCVFFFIAGVLTMGVVDAIAKGK